MLYSISEHDVSRRRDLILPLTPPPQPYPPYGWIYHMIYPHMVWYPHTPHPPPDDPRAPSTNQPACGCTWLYFSYTSGGMWTLLGTRCHGVAPVAASSHRFPCKNRMALLIS